MLGLIEDLRQATPMAFQNQGDEILLVGAGDLVLGGSSYLKVIHNVIAGKLPALDFKMEKSLQKLLLSGIKEGIIISAHDVSDGGLAVTLAECCICARRKRWGARISLKNISVETLFSEAPSRVVISINPGNEKRWADMCLEYQVPCEKIGIVEGEELEFADAFSISVEEMENLYSSVIL
jgi:phosphoribosylformylglycinamidine synthase